MSARDLIILDIETTGLDTETCAVLEIAAIRASDGDSLYIVPQPMSSFTIDDAPAFAVNRYFERRVWEDIMPAGDVTAALETLYEWLDGNTLGGSNPRFDLAVLTRFYLINGLEPPKPHYRLADLSAFAAGNTQHLKATELPGLHTVCGMLAVDNYEPHSAIGDAEATLACFRKLGAVPERTT